MSENKVQNDTTPVAIVSNDDTVELAIDKSKAVKWTAVGVFALGGLWLLNDKVKQLRGKSNNESVEYVVVETPASSTENTDN